MADFHIDKRIAKNKDIQRAYQFELIIPSVTGTDLISDNFAIQVRSASIPGRGNEPITSTFFGQEKFYPGKPTWGGNQLTVEVEEYDDQSGLKALNSWSELMFNSDFTDTGAGGGGVAKLPRASGNTLNLCKDITLKMYKYDGTPMPKKCLFKQAWPETVSETALAYTSNDSVKYSVQFRWDYWLLQDN
jgi:hypothetical protein